MLPPMESTYQGYVSSTHDALLVFECVRRGVMPKVKRRLREEERKLIKSGQVFVFDEKESGIKRWTDGLVWSPSRILWNFLVYRQVDKKFSGRPGTAASPKTLEGPLPVSESISMLTSEYDPYALGVTGISDPATFTSVIRPTHSALDRPGSSNNLESSRNRSLSSASDTFANWISNDTTAAEEIRPGSLPTQRVIDDERNLVGSLKSSYPFAKGGLCKKTISIQVDGSTQHLISYYSVEDVRSGRLRTPSSLPEIASLTISPILLTKTSFRFPPTIHVGPDGIPRFRGTDGYKAETASNLIESSGECNSSGSESRYTFYRSDPAAMRQQYSHTVMPPMNSPGIRGPLTSSAMLSVRTAPMAHQVGGSGSYRPTQRSPVDVTSKSRRSFEPYPKRTSQKSISDESSLPPSPGSSHSGPIGLSGRRLDGLPDSSQDFKNMAYYPHSFDQTSSHQSHTIPIAVASGMTISAEDSLNPYKEEEESRLKLMDELLADQMTAQETSISWHHSPDPHQDQIRQRAMDDLVNEEARWAHNNNEGLYGSASLSHGGPVHYAPSNRTWSNTASISRHIHSPLGYEEHQQPTSRPSSHYPPGNSMQGETIQRQHHQPSQHMERHHPPSFVVSAPDNGFRAALSRSFSHNRLNYQPMYHDSHDKQAIPSQPIPIINNGTQDGLQPS